MSEDLPRLSLLSPTQYDAAQRAFARKAIAALQPRAKVEGFQIELDDGQLVGPFNPLLRSPRMGSAILDFQALEARASSLDARSRQIVILAVGGASQAPYILYSHRMAAERAGLPAAVIESLSRGELPPMLGERERLCAECTFALVRSGSLDQALFAQAMAAFGARGVVDLVVLTNSYRMLADLLNVFAENWPY